MERNLTTGSIPKTIFSFSLPYFLSYFLQTLYGTADLFIIGQFNSVDSTTAVSIGSQVMHMLTVMIVGLAMGTTVMTGRAVGAQDRRQVNLAVGNTASLFMLLSVALTAILLCFVKPIVAVMSTPEEAVSSTISYLTICFLGIPFITAYNIISSIFRGMGDSKSPMFFIAIACAFNIALDYLFIGVLKLGPTGAALGTTLSQTISVLISLTMICHKRMIPEFHFADLKPVRSMMGGLLKIGFPIAMQDGFIQIAFIIITIIANRRGLNDAAAVGIVEKIISLFFLVPVLYAVYRFGPVRAEYWCRKARSGKPDSGLCHHHCGVLWYCDFHSHAVYRTPYCQPFFRQCRCHPSGQPVPAQLYLGLRFCRNPLLFQRILLCLWTVWNLIFAQHHFRALCPHSAGLSGIKILSGQPVSHGLCCSGRVPAFRTNLCHCLRVDEKSARTERILSMQTDRTALIPGFRI